MQWQSAFSDVRVATRLFPNDFGEDVFCKCGMRRAPERAKYDPDGTAYRSSKNFE